MKFSRLALIAATIAATPLPSRAEVDHVRATNTVVLDEIGAKNLRIESVEAEESTFEEAVFSLGRIEAIPAKRAGVSSRISGRVTALNFTLGNTVQAGAEILKVESRQPGNPPPVISIDAPIGGLVTKSPTALGDPVEPSTAIMEITDLSEVFAIARVPENQAGRMQPGTIAHITVATLPGQTMDGELLRFGTEADRESGTIDAVFRVTNPDSKLRPGVRAEFSIVLSKRDNVMSVPRAALQGEPSNRFVYVKDFGLKYAYIKTKVEIGEMNDQFVEILGGLLPGDEVVTRGAYSLAFAGGGSVSLKAALDAAHGHEHNEDGSELTAAQKAAKAGAGGEHHDHGAEGAAAESPFWKITSGVLGLMLIVAVVKGRKGSSTDEDPSSPSNPELV